MHRRARRTRAGPQCGCLLTAPAEVTTVNHCVWWGYAGLGWHRGSGGARQSSVGVVQPALMAREVVKLSGCGAGYIYIYAGVQGGGFQQRSCPGE